MTNTTSALLLDIPVGSRPAVRGARPAFPDHIVLRESGQPGYVVEHRGADGSRTRLAWATKLATAISALLVEVYEYEWNDGAGDCSPMVADRLLGLVDSRQAINASR